MKRSAPLALTVLLAVAPSIPHADLLVPGAPSALAHAVALAQAASDAQIRGIPRSDRAIVRYATIPQAIDALAARHGLILDPGERGVMTAALDGLDRDLLRALHRVVEAFVAFDVAASEGTLADIASTRGHLLTAAIALSPVGRNDKDATCEVIGVPRILTIDAEGCDTIYGPGYTVLSIDLGGDDVYHNNAGGACSLALPIALPIVRTASAAASIDLSGDDRYEPQVCWGRGVNGGAYVRANGPGDVAGGAAGFLFDADGDDYYVPKSPPIQAGSAFALNGGAAAYRVGLLNLVHVASGFLLDARGNDTYSALPGADLASVNGGAVGAARGLLIDAAGIDTYIEAMTVTIDCSVVPKGNGARIDIPYAACP